jgi:hypothetical protein
MRALIDGVAISFDRLALFLETVATEANPATAVDCLEEWFDQYGMPWLEAGSYSAKQEDALSRYITTGDQDIVYIQRMLNEAGFDGVTIYETPSTRVECEITAGNSFIWAGKDVPLLVGKTFECGVWLKNIDISSTIKINLRNDWFEPITVEYGSTDPFSIMATDWTLVTFSATIPLGIVNPRVLIVVDINAPEVNGEKFEFQDGFIGDLNVGSLEFNESSATFVDTNFVSPDIFEFNVVGTVNTDDDFNRLATLIQRLSPAHCEPVYDVARAGNVWGGGVYGDAVCSGR